MTALDLSGARWRKSSRSSDVANCVEVAFAGPVVALRDSKNPTGGVLAIPPRAWRAFTTALRVDELSCSQQGLRHQQSVGVPGERLGEVGVITVVDATEHSRDDVELRDPARSDPGYAG